MEDKQEEYLLKDTIEEERRRLCSVVRRLGSKLSGLAFTCGALATGFGLYLLFVPQDSLLSTRLSIVFTGALGLVGVLNIVFGLLLLLGED